MYGRPLLVKASKGDNINVSEVVDGGSKKLRNCAHAPDTISTSLHASGFRESTSNLFERDEGDISWCFGAPGCKRPVALRKKQKCSPVVSVCFLLCYVHEPGRVHSLGQMASTEDGSKTCATMVSSYSFQTKLLQKLSPCFTPRHPSAEPSDPLRIALVARDSISEPPCKGPVRLLGRVQLIIPRYFLDQLRAS